MRLGGWPPKRTRPWTRERWRRSPFSATEASAPEESGLAEAFGRLTALPGLDHETALALLLAKAISPNSAAVPERLGEMAARALSPEAQIELVVWVAVQQMLHRLGSYLETEVPDSGHP